MDRATLTLLGSIEYLAHLVKTRCRGRTRQDASTALERVKSSLLATAAAHGKASAAARQIVQSTATSLGILFEDNPDLQLELQAIQQGGIREVYPPPLPSSSSGGSPIKSGLPALPSRSRRKPRR